MTFHRSTNPIKYNYLIMNTVLNRVDQVEDLGVVLDPKLTLNAYYATMISKGN